MSSWLTRGSTGRRLPRRHADRRLDVAGRHRPPLLEPGVERAQHLLGRLALGRRPVQRQVVAAAVDRDAEARLDLHDVAVELAAEVDQQAVVGKLQEGVGRIIRVGGGVRGGDRQWASGRARGTLPPRECPTRHPGASASALAVDVARPVTAPRAILRRSRSGGAAAPGRRARRRARPRCRSSRPAPRAPSTAANSASRRPSSRCAVTSSSRSSGAAPNPSATARAFASTRLTSSAFCSPVEQSRAATPLAA